MSVEEIRGQIQTITNGLLKQKGLPQVVLIDETPFLGGKLSIDSLDLAVVVTELQRVTKVDPFKEGFRNFRTVGELARLYAEAAE